MRLKKYVAADIGGEKHQYLQHLAGGNSQQLCWNENEEFAIFFSNPAEAEAQASLAKARIPHCIAVVIEF